MSKIKRVKYFTKEKLDLINEENKNIYQKYLKSSIIKNKDVKDTTYNIYQNYMNHFLVFIAEKYDNIGLYSEDFFENAVDIMEDYISFCQDILFNNKKVINTKISTVSSFFIWSLKRGLINRHPFDKKLDRMKGANDEKIINSYFLTDEEVQKIRVGLLDEKKYDIQDQILWEIAVDSANRIGALSKLTLSSMDLENMIFKDIREKRGYLVEVPFGEKAKMLIEEWLEIRKELNNLEVDSLFISKRDGGYRPMAKSTLQNRIRRIGEILGIEDFHGHCIRKTTLNLITEKTGDIALAADLANHKSIETTRSAYIKPKSKTEVRDKIKELLGKETNENISEDN